MQMSLLRIKDGSPVSVGDIVAQVEEVEDKVICHCNLPVAIRRIHSAHCVAICLYALSEWAKQCWMQLLLSPVSA